MRSWQGALGFWGGMIWLGSFQAAEYAKTKNWDVLYSVLGGYILGFITTFSGYVLCEIVSGRASRFLDTASPWRFVSAIPLVLMLIAGAAGFIADIWGNTPWYHNLAFFIAGLVVAKGVIPLINYLDGGRMKI